MHTGTAIVKNSEDEPSIGYVRVFTIVNKHITQCSVFDLKVCVHACLLMSPQSARFIEDFEN
jgi:hypothetical protein